MKGEIKTSILAVVCVLLCSTNTGALAASSVRTLGGSGTYTSASSAATSGGTASTLRGGSVRVGTTSSSSDSVSKPVGATTTGSVVTTPRLSIGQYLGGGTSVSGGSSLRPQTPSSGTSSSGGTIDPGVEAGLQRDVDQLKRDVEGLNDRADILQEGLDSKQEALLPTPDGYIVIDERTNEIFVDVENLKDAIGTVSGQDGREVEIGSNSTHLLWRYVGDPTWNELISLEEIRGPQGEQGPQGEPGTPADLSEYSTTVEMNLAIQDAIDRAADNYATKADLDSKVNVGDVYTKSETYTKTEVEQKIADAALSGEVDLTNYATKDELDLKADKTELTGFATTDSVNAALENKADKSTVSDLSGKLDDVALDVAAAAGLASQASSDASTAKSEADKANQALANKADKSELTNLATKEELAAKADTSALDAYATTEAMNAALANKADTTALDSKADKSDLTNLATKDELAAKANADDVYKKSETYSAAKIDEKIAQAAAGGEVDLSGYAEKAYVDNQLELKADKTELSDLATKEELAAKADSSALDAKADKSELANLATKDELAQKADATALDAKADKSELTNLATKDELNTKADVAALGAYATTESMNTALANKADVSALDSKADKSELTDLATKEELSQKADKSELTDLATKEELAAKADATALDSKADKSELTNLATKDELAQKADASALSAYATTESMNAALANKADTSAVTTLEGRVSANEAGISELNTKVGSGELTTTSKEVIGAINELKTKTDGMATDGNFEEMNNKITQMEEKVNDAVSSVSGKAEQTYVDEQLALKANEAELGALAKKDQITDADVAENAAISRSKLATDVQEALQKADAAVSMEGAGANKLLGTDENGDEVWYSIAF